MNEQDPHTVGTAGTDSACVWYRRHRRTPSQLLHVVLHVQGVTLGVWRPPLRGQTDHWNIGQGRAATRCMPITWKREYAREHAFKKKANKNTQINLNNWHYLNVLLGGGGSYRNKPWHDLTFVNREMMNCHVWLRFSLKYGIRNSHGILVWHTRATTVTVAWHRRMVDVHSLYKDEHSCPNCKVIQHNCFWTYPCSG